MGVSLKRLESLALRELSALLRRDDSNRGLSGVGITEVRITNDLSYMTIYYTFLMGKRENYDALLEKHKGYIRHELAKKLKARKMPDLIFCLTSMHILSDDCIFMAVLCSLCVSWGRYCNRGKLFGSRYKQFNGCFWG